MTREFRFPDVGEGIAEGEVVQLLIDPGEPVSEDQPIISIETDKSLVDLPSPTDGTIDEFYVQEGDVIAVGDVLVTIDPDEEAHQPTAEQRDDDSDQGEPEPATEPSHEDSGREPAGMSRVFAPPRVRRLARERNVDIEALDGTGRHGRVTEDDVRAISTPDSQSARDTLKDTQQSTSAEPANSIEESVQRNRTLTTPAVRRIAAELSVDLDAVPAEGHHNGIPYVTEQAVRQYAGRSSSAQPPTQETANTLEERVPYRGIRRTIGQQMERSRFTAPHVTRHQQVDARALVEIRESLKPYAESEGANLTYMPFVMKAVVAALKAYPYMNSSLNEDDEEIVLKKYYHLGVATATDAGLMVPVIDDVDEKGLLEISHELQGLAQKARDRTISRDELQGSTFTITNIGPIGGLYGTPIINYPESGILALGELKQRPWVEDGTVVARHTLPLSLSYDHRLIDGETGARFMNTFMKHLRNPELLLLE